MASERQIEANRENAKKSTGPRTVEGKEAVSGNAIKHGLTASKRVVILDESAEQFERLHSGLQAETVTGTELERGLIDEVAAAMWRLRRAARIERDMMEEDIRKALWNERYNTRKREKYRASLIEQGDADLAPVLAGTPPDPNDPLRKKVLLGEQVRERLIKDDGYAKLGRYEVQLRRGLYQAVRELRMLRTQYARDFPQSPRRTAGGGDQQPAATADAPAPNDTSFATDKAAGPPVARVKPRQKADKAKKVKKAEAAAKVEAVAAAKKVEGSSKPSPEPRKGLGPRCGRRGQIVPSRHEGVTSEMILPDGSVVRIS
jgi:hypothetical protein